MRPFLLAPFYLSLIYNISLGTPEDLNRIPNGSDVYTAQLTNCQICHEFSQPTVQQSQLRQFGTDYKTYGKSWGQSLAKLDSDGDGYINEVELKCTNYSWVPYSGRCGSAYKEATNPGDPLVMPGIAVEKRPAAGNGAPFLFAKPNPFNPGTTICFSLPGSASTALLILDHAGRILRSFSLSAGDIGHGRIEWNGKDAQGRSAAAGVYLARLSSGGKSLTVRLVLAR
jgi:hypothetical protein